LVSISVRIRTDTGLVSDWSELLWFQIIERQPSGGIDVEPEQGDIKTQFSFYPSVKLEDIADQISSYRWTFGDGAFAENEIAFHNYLDDGIFDVTLTVTYTADGGKFTFFTTVLVQNTPPKASFFLSASSVFVDDVIVFDASTTTDVDDNLTDLDFSWIFGDGEQGDGIQVSHSYGEEGTYTVRLQVTDDDNARAFFTMNITVNAKVGQDDTDKEEGLSNLELALIIIGTLVAVLVVLMVVLMWVKQKKRERPFEEEEIEE
jgi:PKD repeat protein